MSIVNGICEFCGQVVVNGANCTCDKAKEEKKSN